MQSAYHYYQPDPGSSLEANYMHYTYANNPHAHAYAHTRPLTYDSLGTSSMAAQPSTGMNSSLSQAPPSAMHYGYGSPVVYSGNEHWGAHPPPPATAPTSAPAPAAASYQAFDHSAGKQPLTNSVLALHSAPYQQHQQYQQSQQPLHDKPSPPPLQANRNAGPNHPPAASTTRTSLVSYAPAAAAAVAAAAGSALVTAPLLHKLSSKPEPSAAPSTLESDMATAGFSGTHSKYPSQPSHSTPQEQPSTIHPQIRSSALNSLPTAPAHVPHTSSTAYPMPQPIYQSATSLAHHHKHKHPTHKHSHTHTHTHKPSKPTKPTKLASSSRPTHGTGLKQHAQSFSTSAQFLPQHKQQCSVKPTSYSMPGVFSMPSLGGHHRTQPKFFTGSTTPCTRPKKHVHFTK